MDVARFIHAVLSFSLSLSFHLFCVRFNAGKAWRRQDALPILRDVTAGQQALRQRLPSPSSPQAATQNLAAPCSMAGAVARLTG